MLTEQAVALSRAIAAAYASAVEASGQRHARRKSSSKAAAGKGAHHTPRRKSKADTPRRRDAGTPSFGVGLGTPRRTVAAHRPVVGSTRRPQVPIRFAAAVSALSAVPCVQPELMRALRAVLNRFPRAPIAVLRRPGPENRVGAKAGEHVREKGGGGGGGEMAPPPPRPPSGKKRRVSLETGGLRTSADGKSGRRGDSGRYFLLQSGLRKRGRAYPTTPAESAKKAKTAMMAPLAGESRSGWPPVFSGDSAALEAIEVVLARAKAAINYFTPAQDEADTDRGNADNESALAGVQTEKGATAAENGRSLGRLHPLFQHTTAVTCALRMFAPFVDAARRQAAGRRLEFKGRWQSRRLSTPCVAWSGKRGPGIQENSSMGDGTWPSVIDQLVDAFTAAVEAVVRFETGDIDSCGESRDPAAVDPSPPRAKVTPEAADPRLIAGLWDTLVSCAAELPAGLLVRRPSRGGNEGGSGAGAGAGGAGNCGESRSSRVGSTVGSVAEQALRYVLSPGWRDDGEAQEGLTVTGTFFGPSATPSLFPLRCFLLAAAISKMKLRDDEAGGSRQRDRGARGARKSNDKKEQRSKKKRAHSDLQGSVGRGGGGNGEKDDDGGDEHDFDADKAFLDGLRHDGSALVAQSAMASLPNLLLCCNTKGECLSNSSGGTGSCKHFTEHAATCNWKTRWIPALLALCENRDHDGSEAVRLELAAGLIRLGASLDSSARRVGLTTKKATAATAAGHQQRSRHQHRSGGELPLGALFKEVPAGPNVFVDMLPLWPPLLKDESVVVRAAAARAVLAAAAAAPLSRLRAAGAAGAAVLRLLTDMLACGDPEVAWVVAGSAGQFVTDGGKILRAMYHYSTTVRPAKEGRGSEGTDVEEEEEEEDEDEDTCDAQEEQEREVRSREQALSKFIDTIGKMLEEHGDRLRLGRWQSLHEFTALLRALGYVFLDSCGSTDDVLRTCRLLANY